MKEEIKLENISILNILSILVVIGVAYFVMSTLSDGIGKNVFTFDTSNPALFCQEKGGTYDYVVCGYACGYKSCLLPSPVGLIRYEIVYQDNNYFLVEGRK